MGSLSRILNPRSIAVIGGSWAFNVIKQLQKSGYQGEVWPVNPKRERVLGIPCYSSLTELPATPDAAFIGVNREQTVQTVSELKALGAGGAACFASGFRESDTSNAETDLQTALIEAAGDMPILGPNCYGFINYLDNVTLWPDQHGGHQVNGGVAIIAQSSNIAINMTMQKRGLRLGMLVTVGNQAQTNLSDLAEELIADDRISVIGLYIEGFADLRAFEGMARSARQAGKTIVALKIGKSQKAKQATLTHTASLAGSHVAASALMERLGIIEVNSVTVFLETLKLLDGIGPLVSPAISSVSCSGGEASLMADMAADTCIEFRDFTEMQLGVLSSVLGEKVTIANPLDYHTYIWGHVPSMTQCFAAVLNGEFALNVFVLDIPRDDVCDPAGHECAIEAVITAKSQSDANVAVISLLPENLNEVVTKRLQAANITPLHGIETAVLAIEAAIKAGDYVRRRDAPNPVWLANNESFETQILTEHQAKLALHEYGLVIPNGVFAVNKERLMSKIDKLNFPLVLKGQGIAHKTEAGAVIIGITDRKELDKALTHIPECDGGYLLEEMVASFTVELIVGVTRDELGLFLLTIGAGGVLTEILQDTVSVLLPTTRNELSEKLQSLKVASLLNGYRGQSSANIESLLSAIEAVANYVENHADSVTEIDINPLLVNEKNAIAVDALVRLRK